jgi:hypothetical protein
VAKVAVSLCNVASWPNCVDMLWVYRHFVCHHHIDLETTLFFIQAVWFCKMLCVIYYPRCNSHWIPNQIKRKRTACGQQPTAISCVCVEPFPPQYRAPWAVTRPLPAAAPRPFSAGPPPPSKTNCSDQGRIFVRFCWMGSLDSNCVY